MKKLLLPLLLLALATPAPADDVKLKPAVYVVGSGASVVEPGGRLKLTSADMEPGHNAAGCVSAAAYDFRDRNVTLKVPVNPQQAEVYFILQVIDAADELDEYRIDFAGGAVRFITLLNGPVDSAQAEAYSATGDYEVKIEHTAVGGVRFYTRPSGGTWTLRHTDPTPPFTPSSVKFRPHVATYDARPAAVFVVDAFSLNEN